MGGEDLKKITCILILFGIGLFIQIPIISAQPATDDTESGQISGQDDSEEINRDHLLEAERSAFTFTDSADIEPSASGSSTWSVIRMILVLALAAAAIYGIVYFIKKKTKGDSALKDPFLKVLANSHLGNNRYAHIISVGNKAWLLGSSDGGVNLIGEIEDKDIINEMLLEDSRKTAEGASGRLPDFKGLLRKLGVQVDKKTPDADDLRKRRERLKQM